MRAIGVVQRGSSVRSIPEAALTEELSDAAIGTICSNLGHRWRDRQLPPPVMVRSMIHRSLHPNHSIRATLVHLAAWNPRNASTPTDSAWCQARSRLPEELLPQLLERSAERLARMAGPQYHYRGRPVYIHDGSTVSMPDEPELVEVFGYAKARHGLSRFPLARVSFLMQAGTEGIVDYRLDAYRTSEDAQFHAMWHRIPRGALCLCDRHYSSFYNLAKLRQRGIAVLSRLHQRRDPQRLMARGRKVGPNEWMVPLELAPQLRRRYNDPRLPQRTHVRLIRVTYRRHGIRRTLWLVTTLLDAQRYPRRELVGLYRRRWGIETRIGSVKTSLEMAVLRSKSEANIRKEVAAILLAHNLTWIVIHQSARQHDICPDRISFTGAVQTILAYCYSLDVCRGPQRSDIYAAMLHTVASQVNRYRPNRLEPRLVKRVRQRYSFLKIPREQARRTLT